MKYYIKVITGFREDQFVSIPMQEAHKAYYLFKNPEERGVFENGAALIGKNIQEIKPDWNATMGWNPEHEVDELDMAEIEKLGASEKMSNLLYSAKQSGDLLLQKPELSQKRLQDLIPLLDNNESLLEGENLTKRLSPSVV